MNGKQNNCTEKARFSSGTCLFYSVQQWHQWGNLPAVTGAGALLTCPSGCWTAWVTAKDIVADRPCTSTVIRFCESAVVTDSAVSSEALRLLDFDRVVGVERFFDGIT